MKHPNATPKSRTLQPIIKIRPRQETIMVVLPRQWPKRNVLQPMLQRLLLRRDDEVVDVGSLIRLWAIRERCDAVGAVAGFSGGRVVGVEDSGRVLVKMFKEMWVGRVYWSIIWTTPFLVR